MNQSELIAKVASISGESRKAVEAVLKITADVVAAELQEGGEVTLPGIGKVACRARPERQVRNPQTQEMMTKPADKVVKVTIAKALKDSVNA